MVTGGGPAGLTFEAESWCGASERGKGAGTD